MCQTFMPGAKLKDHTALLGDYCERGEKRTEFLSFPAKSDHRFAFTTPSRYSLSGLVISGTRTESQNTESVICSQRSGEDLRNLGWEDQAVVLTLLAFCFLLY